MARPDDLLAVPLFASLSGTERADLAEWFDDKPASAGVRLIGEGAAGYSFFVLLEGTAEVTADGRKLADVGPGEFFGEIAILGDGRRSATVTMSSAGRVLVMFGTDFRRLQQERPAIAALIENAMRERLADGAG
jgi:CRP-like cAMP-binding protein